MVQPVKPRPNIVYGLVISSGLQQFKGVEPWSEGLGSMPSSVFKILIQTEVRQSAHK